MSLSLLSQIIDNPIPYAHALGYTLLREDLHKDWIKTIFLQGRDSTLQAHRDSYKTTCLIIALGLRMIARPQKNVIFLRKDEAATKEVIRSVRKDLDSGIVGSIVKNIYDVKLSFPIDSANELQTNLYSGSKECQLIGKGIKNGLTGLHGDVVTDDIVNLKDRVSEAERKYTNSVYQELHNIAGKYGHIANTGTPWHKDDAFKHMPKPIIHTVHTTGIFTPEEITEKKSSMTPSLFAANYELKHIADGDVLFTEPKYGKYPIGARTLAHIDAAYGGKDGCALTVMTEVDNDLYFTGWLMEGHIEKHYREISSRMDRYQAEGYDCEKNADKGYLQKDLRNHTPIPGTTYHEGMNKYYKISTYGKARWKNVIFDLQEDQPQEVQDQVLAYINQIMEYNENAEHDDAPDSFASLVKRRYYTSEQSFH